MSNKDEIVFYQPDDSIRLDVRVEEDSVWLTQAQMVVLFERDKSVISRHIANIYKEGELDKQATVAFFATVQNENGRLVERQLEYYDLDMIISVGYRVKSKRGIEFRQWATKVLKDYLLRGYAIGPRIEKLEYRMAEAENKIDFFVQKALPPVEGIFYDNQVFDAYTFIANLIKSAKQSIVLIDNYIDESVLLLLSKRAKNVTATIYTKEISNQLQLDLKRHQTQYPAIAVEIFTQAHDRFLIVDSEVYHIGASLKDVGKKMFAFTKMGLRASDIIKTPVQRRLCLRWS